MIEGVDLPCYDLTSRYQVPYGSSAPAELDEGFGPDHRLEGYFAVCGQYRQADLIDERVVSHHARMSRKHDIKQFRQACKEAGLSVQERYEASEALHAEKATGGAQAHMGYRELLAWLRQWKS